MRGTVSADLEAVNAGLIGGQGAHFAGHLRHPARAHIGLGLKEHSAGYRLAVRHMDEADCDGGFARTRRLGLDQLKTVVVGGGEPVSRDKRRGSEENRRALPRRIPN